MTVIHLYWLSTIGLSLLYLSSALLYLARRDFVLEAQRKLGYCAAHLVPFMIVVKILGPIAILTRLNIGLSDLAYAGMLYHLVLSGLAHLNVRQAKSAIPALIGLILLSASFTTQNAARSSPSPYNLDTFLSYPSAVEINKHE